MSIGPGLALVVWLMPSAHMPPGVSYTPLVSPCGAAAEWTAPPDLETLLTSAQRRVRALSARTDTLLADGARRSPTLRRILTLLEERDVIVQIVDVPHLPPPVFAQLVLVPIKTESRLLRIQLGNRRRGDRLVALLGHELFHALEIANAPEVRDSRALAALYRRIGFETKRELQFDTDEAHQVEQRIRDELAGCR